VTGPILDRTASAEQAATECGTAPVTRAFGAYPAPVTSIFLTDSFLPGRPSAPRVVII
jgi:hypothetical protein